MEHLAVQLVGQPAGLEVALEHLESRTIVELALLPFHEFVVRAHRAVDDDQLGRDPARLAEEPLPVDGLQVSVEMTRERPVERVIRERQL